MERNQFSSGDSTLGQPAGSTAGSGSSQSGFGSSHGESTAQEKLADVASSVRERAGTMKNSLADALTSGADRLRQRGTSSGSTAQYAGATDTRERRRRERRSHRAGDEQSGHGNGCDSRLASRGRSRRTADEHRNVR